VNLIDFAHGFALGTGGEVFEVNDRGKLSLVETVAGARALGESWIGLTIVGNDGLIASIPDTICFE
jgi:hypothetical protein